MSNETMVPKFNDLSITELDQTLEDAVLEHERSEQLICFALLEMNDLTPFKLTWGKQKSSHEVPKRGMSHQTPFLG